MPGPAAAPRIAVLAWVFLFAVAPHQAWAGQRPTGKPSQRPHHKPAARPVGTADGPADVALAIGTTTAAATATGLWLRSRHRREAQQGGEP
ncbi:hypothetical protein ACWCQL_31725 [Streptomyces sp. NPDC002073]|uniref:hypothetical protein n=1 Tax=Streptomyces sp. NBC_00239 TaxID=2903640 RepID=UPI002E282370|nr:hypothetical protein [Streptomyces sp. NBC_00239]